MLLATLFVLAACSAAPLTFDLLPSLGENVSGTAYISTNGNLNLQLPDANGITFSDFDTIELRPSMVGLDYQLDLSQNGNLQGVVQVTFYLAAPGADLWDSNNRLGEPKQVNMTLSRQTLSGSLSLNDSQIDALMAGTIVVGVKITGNVTGSANVSYEFKQLTLKVAFL